MSLGKNKLGYVAAHRADRSATCSSFVRRRSRASAGSSPSLSRDGEVGASQWLSFNRLPVRNSKRYFLMLRQRIGDVYCAAQVRIVRDKTTP